MKRVERILIKLVVIQLFFLLFFQLVFHRFGIFPEINPLTRYEGVSGTTYTKILEVISQKNSEK
ncbi:DUF5359 family protein [Neobacillus terrae]|uniref:DUF5359 family protein n=1 Tax=Neobacillus terrae TaxID=3034837 RepID=UPI00140B6B3C|nr:DUF5359 family protein [Neobacillus terrae]NHM29106.1 YpfB family protein [Neobacillus terrae]